MVTVCDPPSPEPETMLGVRPDACRECPWYVTRLCRFQDDTVERPDAYNERTAWMAPYLAGQLKVSNIIWVIFPRLAFGFNGFSSPALGALGATRSSESARSLPRGEPRS